MYPDNPSIKYKHVVILPRDFAFYMESSISHPYMISKGNLQNFYDRTATQGILFLPSSFNHLPDEDFLTYQCTRDQQIQQRLGENWRDLHERLRADAIKSILPVMSPTQVITPSWYTFDLSQILKISDAVAVCTSVCKHELPYKIFVGRRGRQFDVALTPDPFKSRLYELHDLGRNLTYQEMNVIYDRM
jgi:hypothetical protein